MTDDVPQENGLPPIAPIPPYVAAFILREISPGRWREAVDGTRATNRALALQLERAMAYLREGQAWHRGAVGRAISDRGSPEVGISGESAESNRPPPWGAAQAGHYLGVSARQVRYLCESGALRATRLGRSWAIDPTSVEEYAMRNHSE